MFAKNSYSIYFFSVTLFIFFFSEATPQAVLQTHELNNNPYSTSEITVIADITNDKIVYCDNPPMLFTREFMPGSIFKIPIAIALIMQNKLDTNLIYECKGNDTIAQIPHKCWKKKGHGKQNFITAFANSCNLYFKNMAMSVDLSSIEDVAKSLRLNYSSGFHGDTNKTQNFNLNRNNILGGAFNMSATELLRLALSLAKRNSQLDKNTNLANKKFDILYKAMFYTVLQGTAQNKYLIKNQVLGKTGTVDESMGSTKKVGWFIGFYPGKCPKYAICTMKLKNSGNTAAHIAGKKIEFFIKKAKEHNLENSIPKNINDNRIFSKLCSFAS